MINRNIPKIRFKEFINNWNNYKLGQLGNFKSGIGFPDSQQGGTEGIPFFKVSDMNNIGNETEMRNANNYVTQEQIMKNSWKVINETPAIIFAKVGAALMLNRKRLVTRPFLIDNNTMSYSFDESWDKDFGLTLFQTINLPKYAQIGALPSYNASDIAMIKVNVPNVQEQSAIGSLFRNLDDLLARYKDNLANYQSLKATMLSKMFPKVGHTAPEIRLDGFEGEWDEWKLSDFSQKVTEKNKDNIYSETFTNSAEFGIINQRDFFDKDISNEKSLNSYYVVRNNDYVYNPRISNFAPVGPIKRNKLGRTGVMSPLYFVFRITNSNIDLDFLETFFNTNTWHKFMKLNGDSGARADRFAIKDSVFLNMPITIPSLPEQRAIGSYFSNLDQLITSYQEKISQLETLKKKLLQDMFI